MPDTRRVLDPATRKRHREAWKRHKERLRQNLERPEVAKEARFWPAEEEQLPSTEPNPLKFTEEQIAFIHKCCPASIPEKYNREITCEFDNTEPFQGRLVEVQIDDPRVLSAARAAIIRHNHMKYNNDGIGRLGLDFSIIKANAESLRPDVFGTYYYITLRAKGKQTKEAIYQLKVFSSLGHNLKLFRPASDTGMSNSESPLTSSSSVEREAAHLDATLKMNPEG